MLSINEIIVVNIILILIFREVFKNFTDPDPINLWAPTTIIAFIFFYYVILGPILAILNKETVFRLVEHRKYIINAWVLSLIGLISIYTGFRINRKVDYQPHQLDERSSDDIGSKFGLRLFIIGILGFMVFAGISGTMNQLRFWDIQNFGYSGDQGALRNYFYHAIDMLIPAGVLLFLAFLSKRLHPALLIFILLSIVAIYIKQGYRWRLVLLGISLFMSYFMFYKKKPGLILIVSLILIGILAMGLIGVTRQYGRGLNLTELENRSNTEVFTQGLSESDIFMSTGLLVEYVPEFFDYIYFDPIYQSLVMPIPRKFWPGKPSGDYIKIYENLYNKGNYYYGKGVAVMNFGEYYLAFGYLGVILGSLMLGYAYRRLWEWFKLHAYNPYAIAYYTVAVSFLYMIFSRGYLPQVTMLFFFTVFPAYVVFSIARKRMKEKERKIRLMEYYKSLTSS